MAARVLVVVEGGLVSAVLGDDPTIDVEVHDWDDWEDHEPGDRKGPYADMQDVGAIAVAIEEAYPVELY